MSEIDYVKLVDRILGSAEFTGGIDAESVRSILVVGGDDVQRESASTVEPELRLMFGGNDKPAKDLSQCPVLTIDRAILQEVSGSNESLSSSGSADTFGGDDPDDSADTFIDTLAVEESAINPEEFHPAYNGGMLEELLIKEDLSGPQEAGVAIESPDEGITSFIM